MTRRERVLQAIHHQTPDRIPVDFWAVPEVFQRLEEQLGLEDPEAVLQWADADLRTIDGPARKHSSQPVAPGDTTTDHWGVVRKAHTTSGTRRDGSTWTWTYKHLHKSPLAEATTVADIEAHDWPSPDMWDYSGMEQQCRTLREAGYPVVVGADRLDRTALLKPAMYIRGVESFMEDLLLQPAMAECLLQHISNYYLEYNRRIFEVAGHSIDIFFMGDDMGTQDSQWVSRDMYRRFFKPLFGAYCDLAHQYDMKVMYHTCGNVTPLVGEFIDAGLDILQSLQPAALGDGLVELKRTFGKDLCFQGGIDIQDVLPNGTVEDIRNHVRQRAEELGSGGGYIFGTAHNILPDTPTDNIRALVDAYRDFGAYA